MVYHLIVGCSAAQLREYIEQRAIKRWPNCTVNLSDFVVTVGSNEYRLLVAQRFDARINDVTFETIEYLPGVMWTMKAQYENRRQA